jgi:hypothetical protein
MKEKNLASTANDQEMNDDPFNQQIEDIIKRFPEDKLSPENLRLLVYTIGNMFYQKGAGEGMIAGVIMGTDPKAAMAGKGIQENIDKYVDYLEQKIGIRIPYEKRLYYQMDINFSDRIEEALRKKMGSAVII